MLAPNLVPFKLIKFVLSHKAKGKLPQLVHLCLFVAIKTLQIHQRTVCLGKAPLCDHLPNLMGLFVVESCGGVKSSH